ncbi:MAG: preprotein translocase subunit SecA [Kiritimatiellaeota bacterium]|nr:preprotein translocase subunit SecA [Kiritimatiellota bacterium]
MISFILKTLFGTKSKRDTRKLMPLALEVNEFDEKFKSLSDEQLKAKTPEFKERLANGETLDDIMCEAFAVVKNACRRLCGQTITVCDREMEWNMVPFDVQVMGAVILHRGCIAEMATGEGKTLVATMPLYLNALSGKNCQLVTVNDYLAKRDSEWMGAVYDFLGISVGCILNDMMPDKRREQYEMDITYGTNSEFGFDYLRDMGMAIERDHLVQRDYFYVIIDEVDSILIDEARTPLIISGPAAVSTHQFDKLRPLIDKLFREQSVLCAEFAKEAKEVIDDSEADSDALDDAYVKLLQVKMGMPQHRQLMRMLEDGSVMKRLEKTESFVRSDQNRGMLQDVQSDLYFTIDERGQEADLTERGRGEISPDDPDMFIIPDIITAMTEIDGDTELSEKQQLEKKQKLQDEFAERSEKIHNISQLLRAYCLYEKDIHYVVQDNKVVIVDENTGRQMPGRRFSEGLHQALEAKENVKIERETQTLATVTIQNYFRMYDKLAGMTGTAETEATEFNQTYKMDVVVIPTNKPCLRVDYNDKIYKTKREKYKAIIEEVRECHEEGRPVLLGTVSVEVSEILSRMLKRENIPHNVLNAKNHEREAEIIERAGQIGAVTVATNMAGRGTDIKLAEGVPDLGGLHVLGSERHDARRIDRQLRGRCARQGDPGSSSFYISLEDNLMRLFGSDRIASIMSRLGLEEGEELQHPWLNKSIGTAQKRVEQHHYSIRKRTLEYDDVMNKQREVVYGLRRDALLSDDPGKLLFDIIRGEVEERVDGAFSVRVQDPEDMSIFDEIVSWLNSTMPLGFTRDDILPANENIDAKTLSPMDMADKDVDAIIERIMDRINKAYDAKIALEDPESQRWLERHTILEAIDRLWQEHLYAMDSLRSSITLRAYAQKDPLVEYKQEAFQLFSDLMGEISQEVMTNVFRSASSIASFENLLASLPQQLIHDQMGQFDGNGTEDFEEDEPVQITFVRDTPKVGRNDPCPCGSGKKYKKCCGA